MLSPKSEDLKIYFKRKFIQKRRVKKKVNDILNWVYKIRIKRTQSEYNREYMNNRRNIYLRKLRVWKIDITDIEEEKIFTKWDYEYIKKHSF
jgi:hypothetical protein